MKKNALIIGCGNIGALYDFENKEITTHAKALFLTKKTNLFFYDINTVLAKKVTYKYQGVYVEKITDELLNSIDWISLCSSTDTHYLYLEKLFNFKNKFVLCEKPISYDLNEIDELNKQYKKSLLTIYVNYIRRFQPAYINFKKKHSNLFLLKNLKECSIDYCRGFVNNASHAFDLLEFFFEEQIDLKNINVFQKEFDTFKNDPTISLTAEWKSSKIIVNGHANVFSPVFQIKLIFDFFSIAFLNSGKEIIMYDKNNKSIPVFLQQDCLKNYMQHVVSYFVNTKATSKNSNFISALQLNKKMLNYINH